MPSPAAFLLSLLLLLSAAIAVHASPLEQLAQQQQQQQQPTCRAVIDAHYPRQYVAYKRQKGEAPPDIDGDILFDKFWRDVPWTTDFVDIVTPLTPPMRTRAKIRYDDEFVYVGVQLFDDAVWSRITECCHCVNSSQDQVVFNYNDIEVFFDPTGSTHGYKEAEFSPANVYWSLLLNAPYMNGGYENSTRVLPPSAHPFDYYPSLRSAVKFHGGAALNDPNSRTGSPESGWTIEIAFPIYKIVVGIPTHIPARGDGRPAPGVARMYRINLSRVQYQYQVVDGQYHRVQKCYTCDPVGSASCDNWLWQPMTWPAKLVDIHLPEQWAFLEFVDKAPQLPSSRRASKTYNTEWPARAVASILFWSLNNFSVTHNNTFTDNVSLLVERHTQFPELLVSECTGMPVIQLLDGGKAYVATIPSIDFRGNITVTNTRLTAAWYEE